AVQIVMLEADAATLTARLIARRGHFFPAKLLQSQLGDLEMPDHDERTLVVPTVHSPAEIADEIIRRLGLPPAPRRGVPRGAWPGTRDGVMKLKLDLHDIYNRGHDIDRALHAIIDEAVAKKAPVVEIIPGKGSGQLKKRVLRFLDQKEIKALYHRVEKDSKNHGRLFVHFRWK